MSSSDTQARAGKALADYAVDSKFPDEEAVIVADFEGSALPAALESLNIAKSCLEDEIRIKSREAAPNVDKWIEHARTLQDDIESSKRLANHIVRQAEEEEKRQELIKDQEQYLAFLESEVGFSKQLHEALMLIQEIRETLQRAEDLIHSRQILTGLQTLEMSWNLIARIPASRTAPVVRLLDAECLNLRESARDLMRSVWENLIVVDRENGKITINKQLDGDTTTIGTAVTSLVAFQQLDKEAKQFWETLDELIMLPRSDLSSGTLRYIKVDGNTICTGAQTTDSTIKSLFIAMEDVIRFLVEHLPLEFRKPLSDVMMPELSARLKEFWLDTAVPASLDDMADYQKSLMQVHQFVERLQSLQWPGSEVFEDWVSDAPKMWITKRRETALDWTRNQLGLGVGMRHPAKRVERRRVGRDESKKLASFGDKVTQDWDAAWGSEDEEMEEEMVEEETLLLGRNRASLEEHRRASEVTATIVEKPSEGDDDDAAEAWGWGDEDTVDGPNAQNASQPPQENPSHDQVNPETREVTLSENYYISSIPQPVFETVAGIFNDAAKLTSSAFEDSPVTPAASGLFNLPTLVLAMYRAVSPFHYTRHQSGNMFAYNDSIWLYDKLVEFQSEWEKRTDLSSRAYGRVKLGPEIVNLESFGKRAYTNELNAQRTIINDLLGGAQNFFQENGSVKGNFEADIDGVLRHIRTVAASWEPILGYSVWASAVGSLVNTVAAKIISDIFDLDDVSVDGAARLASLISEVIKLDDLFLPSTHPRSKRSKEDSEDSPDLIPMTARFADKWMKLKFLSEVLQSNLSDVKYFWFESDLSLYFTADEVVELIGLSFENNANVRQAKREIKERPRPRVE